MKIQYRVVCPEDEDKSDWTDDFETAEFLLNSWEGKDAHIEARRVNESLKLYSCCFRLHETETETEIRISDGPPHSDTYVIPIDEVPQLIQWLQQQLAPKFFGPKIAAFNWKD